MAGHENLLADALDLDRGRMNRYCRTVDPRFLKELNKKKPKTMAALADIWYTSNGASYGRNQHYNDSRYHMLNYHATFTKGTVEFRLFQFDAPADGKLNGLHAGQLKSYNPALPCTQPDGKGSKDGKLETAADRKSEIRNEDMAFKTRIHRG